MPELTGGAERIELGGGYAIVAPGLKGRAERLDARVPATRTIERSTPLLDAVLAQAEITSVATIDISAQPVPGGGRSNLRDSRGDEALELEVPDLGPRAGQVVMSIDEAGAVSWHFPVEGQAIQPPSVRGAGDRKRFRIRKYTPSIPPAGASADRSLFGAIGRKLLKVLVYPITDSLVGKASELIAEHWEAKNRAYGLRDFTPGNFKQAEGAPITPQDLARLSEGPALLFVHGTFSTAHGAFGDTPAPLMSELHGRYGGRVFAFDHFTLSHDPQRNARWFFERLRDLSPSPSLELDIVCHSRGGLVSRTLAEGSAAFGIDTSQAKVRRIVFVAVPNKGTILTEPDHIVNMIDRLTTGLNLFPPSGVADVLEGILIAVKIIGHGALKGLDGLQAMNPNGEFIKKLNAVGLPGAEYYAVAANYEPQDPGLKALVSGAVDAVVDRAFQGEENDLLVPELGVYEANGSQSFPIGSNRRLRLPGSAGVMHTGLFGQAQVAQKLGEWLQ